MLQADLSGTILAGANLSNAVLAMAVLKDADLRGTKCWETDLQGANLLTEKMDKETSFYMAQVAGATIANKGWKNAKNTLHTAGVADATIQ